jgi:UDP-2-acetamido-2,6-beta-L-arabino-hexul-4-ose reductase
VILAVTGADGFLGWHLQTRLRALSSHEVVGISHTTFGDPDHLRAALGEADVVVHLAGVNRGRPDDVENGNEELAHHLVRALDTTGRTPRLVYADSIQAGSDSAYGHGKARAASVLADWAELRGATLIDVVLPNLFGEGGRPDYNSFVATFCHRLATGTAPIIDVDREVELLHAQDAAQVLIAALEGGGSATRRVPGTPYRVSEVLAQLHAISATYNTGRLPDLSDPFTLRLFNTYRYYLHPAQVPFPLKASTDSRGTFVEAVQSLGGGGQTSFSTTKPQVTRGNHFHLRKVERFVVVGGEATIAIRPIHGTTVSRFEVSGDGPVFIDMPTLHTHNITNTGSTELLTLFWTNELFDPADPDTFAEVVDQ